MIRVMIVGAGAIAPAHVEALLQFSDRAKITVVVNRTIARARTLVERYQLPATISTDYTKHWKDIDAVVICTPPGTHKEIAVTCLQHNKDVLLEKPMALSLEECDAINSAAEESHCFVAVVAQSRFISSVYNTITLLKSGNYGSILMVDVNSHWYRGSSYYDLSWRGRWTVEGGGCTLNHTVHHLDLLLWSKGLPSTVMSFMTNLSHKNSEEEDLSIAILTYPDGSVARVTSSLIHHGEKQSIDFQLESIGVSIPFSVVASKSKSNGFPVEDRESANAFTQVYESMPNLAYTHHAGQVDDFLTTVEKRSNPLVGGNDGRMAIELITAIYKSAITGDKVTLPFSHNDPYYTFQGRVEDATRFHIKAKDIASFDDLSITSFKGKY